jgi:hypothetical protein
MQLLDVESALFTVLPTKTWHLLPPPDTPGNYIVWGEDGQSDALHGDGKMINQVIQGTIDYFTKTEYDPVKDQIQAALNNAGIGFRLNSTQYETDTGYIHYEWVFDIPMGVG